MDIETSAMEDATMAEAGVADASLMDNIEDLFGEAADAGVLPTHGLDVPLPSPSPPPELIARLSEMQSSGCCTKLAWSVIGSIAQISENARDIGLRVMLRDLKTGAWSLTEQSAYPIPAPEGRTWQHIQFSNIGIDLVAIDSNGFVHVFSLFSALGKMQEASYNNPDGDTNVPDLDDVVCVHWLPVFPTEFKMPYITPATKMLDRWTSAMSHRDINQPKIHHAADGKQSFLYITCRLKLVLMYQNEAEWHKTSIDLEDVLKDSATLSSAFGDQRLTHASMCESEDHMLLLTYDTSDRFRLYEISISWNATQQPRPGGMPTVLVAPALEVKHIGMLENVAAQQIDGVQLTQLHILPALTRALNVQATSDPTIIAVFTPASLPVMPSHQHSGSFSVIVRWHVESTSSSMHNGFGKAKANAAAANAGGVFIFRRQEDVHTPRLVISVASQYHHTMLALAASDGTIELRDRLMMTTVQPDFDSLTASSLMQCGFEQMPLITEQAVHAATSPDGCAMVYTKPDMSLSCKTMTFRYSWQALDDGMSGLIEAAVVCLARQYAILCCKSASTDEVLALLPLDLSEDLRSLFIRELVRMTGRSMDMSGMDNTRQQQMVLREPLIPRLWGAAYILGVNSGTTSELNTMGRIGSAFINMRSICTSLVHVVGGRPDAVRPEYLHSVRGLAKWAADLLVYAVDVLVATKRSGSTDGTKALNVFERFVAKGANPAVHLLLCSFSRFYLRYLAVLVPKFIVLTQKLAGLARTVEQRHQLMETVKHCTSLPFTFGQFETLIAELDGSIRISYQQGNISAERRTEIDNSFLCGSRSLPLEFALPLDTLLNTAVPKFMASLDQSKLYFWDTDWLGLSGPASVAKARQFDAIRKTPLRKGVKLRLCRRCGNSMEDIPQDKIRDLAPWLMHAQRYCLCFDYWILEDMKATS